MKIDAEIIGENNIPYSKNIDEIAKIAQKNFNVAYLFPWQSLVISNILDSQNAIEKNSPLMMDDGHDDFCRGRQIVLLPTGSGKSLCFLIPALLLKGTTLIIYPLLALMADQKRRMEESKINCVVFKGGQTPQERKENFKRLHEKDVSRRAKVIIANPEVLQDESLLNDLSSCNISHIAIDEAHCVSEWGDSFRPAYLTLGKIIKRLGIQLVTAFTATASPPVLSRIADVLFDGAYHLVQGSSDRMNIHYSVMKAYAKQKAALQCAITMKKPMIIFCATRRRTEEMARILASYFGKQDVRFYHAGMTKEEKELTEKWFFESSCGILTATCAYGMGMDKGNIYSVVHLDAPEHLENFAQEAGRAGRKGDLSHSVLIWNHADEVRYRQAKKGPRKKAIGDFATAKTCRRQVMLDYLGGEKAVCSGCDICDAIKNKKTFSQEAEDAQTVFSVIKKNRRLFRKDEAIKEILNQLNEKTRPLYKINVWESKDVAEILSQLMSERRIKICGGLWDNRLDITPRNPRTILRFIPRKTLHRLHFLRKLFRQEAERLERFF